MRFSPFLAQNLKLSYSQYGFWGILSLTKIISSIRILIVCTSCKTSYNVLSHSYWGLSQFFGGGGCKKKDSLPVLVLQRLASLWHWDENSRTKQKQRTNGYHSFLWRENKGSMFWSFHPLADKTNNIHLTNIFQGHTKIALSNRGR